MAENKSFKEKINNFFKEWWGIILIAFIAMLTIVIFGYFYFSKHSLSWLSGEVEELGQMGDFFGGTLNPILAFLSFCLLLITIKLQSKELKNSRKELSKSSKALKKQSKSLKLQNFENTFFKMLDLHNKIVDKFDGKKDIQGTINIRFKDRNEITEKGFYCKNSFSGIYNEIKNKLNKYNRFDSYYIVENLENISKGSYQCWINKELISCTPAQREEIKNNLKEEEIKYPENQLDISNYIYTECMKVLDNYLAHYLRNIYQILKLIDNNDFINDKKFYSNILRAQLSQDEQGILFHNCVSEFGIKMLPLFIKYEFLEHLAYNKNFSKHDLKIYIEGTKRTPEYYPSKAFGGNIEFAKACAKIIQNNSK